MYSTIRFGTASKAAPQGRHRYRAGVGVELAIKRLPARCLEKNPLLMYSTIKFGTASEAAPQGRHLYRAGVGVELAIKRLPARTLTIRPHNK